MTNQKQAAEILRIEHLSKIFTEGGRRVLAVDDVSFSMSRGEILALAGESGSGKSTIARLVTKLIPPDSGEIRVCGKLAGDSRRDLFDLHTRVQMIFQDAEGSFHPRMRIGDSLLESIRNFQPGISRTEARKLLYEYLDRAGLDNDIANRYPWQVSGGQCQRAAIVRALAAKPEILICDEATSALDVLVQARIIALLKAIQQDTGMSILFISHDLSLISCLCDRVLILQNGRCVEEGTTRDILQNPREAYTKVLIDSIL